MPELREVAKLDEEVRDWDRDKKRKMREHADRAGNAEENILVAGDKVLLKQQQLNKWTTLFESQPYELIYKCGNSVLIESPEGTQYKKNTIHVKLCHEREKQLSGSFREEQPVPQEMEAGDVPTDQRDEGRWRQIKVEDGEWCPCEISTSADMAHTKEVRGFRFVMNIWNIDLWMYFRYFFLRERESDVWQCKERKESI